MSSEINVVYPNGDALHWHTDRKFDMSEFEDDTIMTEEINSSGYRYFNFWFLEYVDELEHSMSMQFMSWCTQCRVLKEWWKAETQLELLL